MDNSERAREMIAQHLDVDICEVEDDAYLEKDLGADSLDTMELVMELEEEFDIDINDETVTGFNTVGDILEYIASHT